MIEIRCIVCRGQWDADYDPPACRCLDGGFWQVRVDGGEWANQYSDTDAEVSS